MNLIDPAQPDSSDSQPQSAAQRTPDGARLASAILWVVAVVMAGSALASFCAIRFDHLGLLVVWPIGWLGGLVATKLLGGRSKLVGGLLGGACFAISLIALVAWIRAEIVQADDSWIKAVGLLPTFFGEWPIFSVVALIVSGTAAMSAWQQVAVRYIRVRIDD